MSAVKIEAFTFEYCELQDRVRLSGNVYNTGIEIHLWLTRRLALRLLESAVDLIEKTSSVIAKTPVDHRAAMALFEHESARLLTENVIETTSKMAGITSDSSLKVNLIEVINRLDISFKDKKYQLSFFCSITRSSNCVGDSRLQSTSSDIIIDSQRYKSLRLGRPRTIICCASTAC